MLGEVCCTDTLVTVRENWSVDPACTYIIPAYFSVYDPVLQADQLSRDQLTEDDI